MLHNVLTGAIKALCDGVQEGVLGGQKPLHDGHVCEFRFSDHTHVISSL